jgi:hypothetical protein
MTTSSTNSDLIALLQPLPCWHESRLSARVDAIVALSSSQALIASDRPLPPGTPLFLELDTARGKSGIDAITVDENDSGFTIEFIAVDADAGAALDDAHRAALDDKLDAVHDALDDDDDDDGGGDGASIHRTKTPTSPFRALSDEAYAPREPVEANEPSTPAVADVPFGSVAPPTRPGGGARVAGPAGARSLGVGLEDDGGWSVVENTQRWVPPDGDVGNSRGPIAGEMSEANSEANSEATSGATFRAIAGETPDDALRRTLAELEAAFAEPSLGTAPGVMPSQPLPPLPALPPLPPLPPAATAAPTMELPDLNAPGVTTTARFDLRDLKADVAAASPSSSPSSPPPMPPSMPPPPPAPASMPAATMPAASMPAATMPSTSMPAASMPAAKLEPSPTLTRVGAVQADVPPPPPPAPALPVTTTTPALDDDDEPRLRTARWSLDALAAAGAQVHMGAPAASLPAPPPAFPVAAPIASPPPPMPSVASPLPPVPPPPPGYVAAPVPAPPPPASLPAPPPAFPVAPSTLAMPLVAEPLRPAVALPPVVAPPGSIDPADAFDVTFTDRFAANGGNRVVDDAGSALDDGFDIEFTAPGLAPVGLRAESAPSTGGSGVVEVDFSEFADVFGASVDEMHAEAPPLPVDEEEVLLAAATVDAGALVDVDASGNASLPPVAAATVLPMFAPFDADAWLAIEPPPREPLPLPRAPALAASPSREEIWRVLGPDDRPDFGEPATPRTASGGNMPGLAARVTGRGLLVDSDADTTARPTGDKPQDGR